MAFARDEVSLLLARCHRRCCICHRFCGVKIETDHINPTESGGTDEIDNAIPVCFECHAEIHSYNDKHPRGRKFLPDELKQHKAEWIRICAEQPELLIGAIRDADVGPLQALIDELDFNSTVAISNIEDQGKNQGCRFHQHQFLRAIHEGSISLLRDDIRKQLLEAYHVMEAANAAMNAMDLHYPVGSDWVNESNRIIRFTLEAGERITALRNNLLNFLSNES